ncbi:MAG: TlpA disulfide reductase family protein [Chloroflexota bacterium]
MIQRLAFGTALLVLVVAAASIASMRIGATSAGWPLPSGSFVATGRAGIAVGDTALDFVGDDGRVPLLVDLDGRPIHLADFAGRPLWIVFWATWCTPCQLEAADILAAYHAHQGDGLAVLAIDLQEPAATVRDYVRMHDLDYAIGLDATAAVRTQYAAWALPSHIFVDGRGVVRDRYLGQLTANLMEEQVRALVGS